MSSGACWELDEVPGVSWELPGSFLGASWSFLELPGASWGFLGASWELSGRLLGFSWSSQSTPKSGPSDLSPSEIWRSIIAGKYGGGGLIVL